MFSSWFATAPLWPRWTQPPMVSRYMRKRLVEPPAAPQGVRHVAPRGEHEPFVAELHEALDRHAEGGHGGVGLALAPEHPALRHRHGADRIRAPGPSGRRRRRAA